MIDWAVYRMMQASDLEQRVWHVHSDGFKGWVVHDMDRYFHVGPLATAPVAPTFKFQRYFFKERSIAERFVTYQVHKAALLAVINFWKRLP